MKKIFLALGFVALTYLALVLIAANQVRQRHMQCAVAVDFTKKLQSAKSKAEARAAVIEVVDCIDKKVRFPLSLFYDREETVASIQINERENGIRQ